MPVGFPLCQRLDSHDGRSGRPYPNQGVAKKVTIRHLLTHTGGTGDIFTPEYNEHRLETRSLSDYVKLYGNRELEFEPGSQFRYSNYGYLLLGVLIEKVSGQSYYDYVQKNIYEPSGMTGTGSLPEADSVPERAVGYQPGKNGWEPNTDNNSGSTGRNVDVEAAALLADLQADIGPSSQGSVANDPTRIARYKRRALTPQYGGAPLETYVLGKWSDAAFVEQRTDIVQRLALYMAENVNLIGDVLDFGVRMCRARGKTRKISGKLPGISFRTPSIPT